MADMTNEEKLQKSYNPIDVEEAISDLWNQTGAFDAYVGSSSDTAFSIVIPPPNVTAALHLGHALNNTLQDVLIRYHRSNDAENLDLDYPHIYDRVTDVLYK